MFRNWLPIRSVCFTGYKDCEQRRLYTNGEQDEEEDNQGNIVCNISNYKELMIENT